MYKVRLQSFEGPFDLLVYLIENAEMSIYEIRISEITTQYLDYIHQMEEQEISVAQEFMVLAASLIEIKSRMILPRTVQEGEDVVDEDPRTELVQRILEYKKFKEISGYLKEQEEHMSHVFDKPQEDISVYTDNPDEYLSLSLDQFIQAFNLFVKRKQRIEAVRKHYTRVERERSVMERKAGKILGTNVSSKFMKCEPTIQKYLGITLLPQAGVALGMSLQALELGATGVIVRNVSLLAILVYELVGPTLTKIALQKAGEITEKPLSEREKAKLEAKNK